MFIHVIYIYIPCIRIYKHAHETIRMYINIANEMTIAQRNAFQTPLDELDAAARIIGAK